MIGVFGSGILSQHFQQLYVGDVNEVVIFSRSRPENLRLGFMPMWERFSLSDVPSVETLISIIKRYKISSAVIFAGISNPNTIDSNLGEACKVNLIGTLRLIDALHGAGVFFVFVSSVEVFNSPGPNLESDSAAPKNYYGLLKSAVEGYVLELNSPAAIVRTTWNIPVIEMPSESGSGRCPITLIYGDLINGRSCWADDYVTNPVLAVDTARVVAKVIERRETGVFHSAGDVVYSRFELAELICSGMRSRQVQPRKCKFRDLPPGLTSRRSQSSILSTAKTRKTLNFQFSNILPKVIDIVCRLEKQLS